MAKQFFLEFGMVSDCNRQFSIEADAIMILFQIVTCHIQSRCCGLFTISA